MESPRRRLPLAHTCTMNYWVGILHTLNKNENQWLTVLGTFRKSQKIPSKKNKIG